MKGFKVIFESEGESLRPCLCQPEKVAELSYEEFYLLCRDPYGDHAFIAEHAPVMHRDDKDICHCVIFLNKGNDDGIIVMDTEDEREIAYMPYAKYYVQKEQYKSLAKFDKIMVEAVEEQLEKALEHQKKGKYEIPHSELYKYEPFDFELFASMMAERDEITMAGVDNEDEVVRLLIAPKFVYMEDDSHLKVITQKEFEVVSAKHLLWLEEGVGQQADFSNCLLRDLEMSDRNLLNMIFDEAKIINSRMNGTDFSYSSFKGTKIIGCECIEMVATETDFSKTKFSNCDLTRANVSSSNFTKAAFWDCDFAGTVLSESCLEKTKFHRTDISAADTTDCVYDEQEWVAERHGLKWEVNV